MRSSLKEDNYIVVGKLGIIRDRDSYLLNHTTCEVFLSRRDDRMPIKFARINDARCSLARIEPSSTYLTRTSCGAANFVLPYEAARGRNDHYWTNNLSR